MALYKCFEGFHRRLLLDGFGFVVITVVMLVLRCGILPPVQRGFFCDDQSIRYPLRESTVSYSHLVFVGIPIPVIIIFAGEFFHHRNHPSVKNFAGRQMPVWFLRAVSLIGTFLWGGSATVILTDIGKVVLGWHRPHFIAVCQPNITCVSNEYVADYECLGDPEASKEAMDSFPSGHAAFTSFVATFVCLYIQRRFVSQELLSPLRPLVQLLAVSLAWITGLTRISDHMHHPMDVISGFVLGTGCAAVTVLAKTNIYRRQHQRVIDKTAANVNGKDVFDTTVGYKDGKANLNVAMAINGGGEDNV